MIYLCHWWSFSFGGVCVYLLVRPIRATSLLKSLPNIMMWFRFLLVVVVIFSSMLGIKCRPFWCDGMYRLIIIICVKG